MNKVDLIFQKQPQEVQEKLMDLLIQYNAVMQYNANDDKFEVDLLIPFISEQQKQQFLKGFYKSRQNREISPTMTIGQYTAEMIARNAQQQRQLTDQNHELTQHLHEKQQSLERVLSDESFEKKIDGKTRSRKNTEINKNRKNQLSWSQAQKGSNVSSNKNQSSYLKRINYDRLAQTMEKSINEALAQISMSKKLKKLNEDPALHINYYNHDNKDKRNQERSLIQDLQNISDKGLALYHTEDVKNQEWNNEKKQSYSNNQSALGQIKKTQYKHNFHPQQKVIQPHTPQFHSQNQELRHIPNKFKNQYKDYANYYTHISDHRQQGYDSKGSLIQQQSSLNQPYQHQNFHHDEYAFAHQDNSSEILIEDSPRGLKDKWDNGGLSGQAQHQEKNLFNGMIQENIQDDEQQFDHANKFHSVRQTQNAHSFKKHANLYEKKQPKKKKSKSPHSNKKNLQLSFEEYQQKSKKNKNHYHTRGKKPLNSQMAMEEYNQALKQVKQRNKIAILNKSAQQNYMRERSNHLSPHSKLRSQYNKFFKDNNINMEHLYGNIRQDIKEREDRNQQGNYLIGDQPSQDNGSMQRPLLTLQQKAFKQEVHAHYVEKIVKNEQLSSQDLIRYFRYLLKNAKQLYSKQRSRGNSQLY